MVVVALWEDIGLMKRLKKEKYLITMILALCAGARRGDELARMARLNSEKSEIRCFTTGAWPSQKYDK